MEAASLVIAVVALVFSLVSTVLTILQLQRQIRFRRPVFVVNDATTLSVAKKGEYYFIENGKVSLSARGAAFPITLTKTEFSLLRNGYPSGGFGSLGLDVILKPEVWSYLEVETGGFGLKGEAPESLRAEIYLSNPREAFIVPMEFKLSEDGSRYSLNDLGEHRGHLYRTIWRRGRIRHLLSNALRTTVNRVRSRR